MDKHTHHYQTPLAEFLDIHLEETICTSITTDAIIVGGFSEDPSPLDAI